MISQSDYKNLTYISRLNKTANYQLRSRVKDFIVTRATFTRRSVSSDPLEQLMSLYLRPIEDGARVDVQRELRSAGFVNLPRMDAHSLDQILGVVQSAAGYKYQTQTGGSIGEPIKHRPDMSTDLIMLKYGWNDVLACPSIVQFAEEEASIKAFCSLFGCYPYIADVELWITYSSGDRIYASQDFHRDRDCFCQLKKFAYISDVDIDNGPHQFVTNSHRQDSSAMSDLSDYSVFFEGNGRGISIKDFLLISKNSELKTVVGPSGSAFIEDTFGFHRGTPVARGFRILLCVTYTSLPLRIVHPHYINSIASLSDSVRVRLSKSNPMAWNMFL